LSIHWSDAGALTPWSAFPPARRRWLRECHRLLTPRGILRLRVPMFGTPWHLIDPTHVRGFHPLNFDYFIRGKELWHKYGHYYFDFAFASGSVQIEGYNIVAALQK
jgi:hypothetical protein